MSTSRAEAPRPPAAARPSGTRRVLLVAGTDGDALADVVADRAWSTARCGLDLDVLAAPDSFFDVLAHGGAGTLRRYDAVVVVADDPLRPREVLGLGAAAGTVRLLVTGPAAPDGPWCSRPAPLDGRLGEEVAGALAELLRERVPGPSTQDVTAHLRRVAQAATGAYGAASAMVALVGPHTVRTLVAVGPRLAPGDRTACAVDRPAEEPTVILDAETDPRTRGAVDPDRVRFLAAHPVEGADGSPIGTVCVFDDEPRTDVDLDVLRDLAVLAGAEIEHALRIARAPR